MDYISDAEYASGYASENRQKTRDLERRVVLLEAKVQQLIRELPELQPQKSNYADHFCPNGCDCREIHLYEYTCDGWTSGVPCGKRMIIKAYSRRYSDAEAVRKKGWTQSGDRWYCRKKHGNENL